MCEVKVYYGDVRSDYGWFVMVKFISDSIWINIIRIMWCILYWLFCGV